MRDMGDLAMRPTMISPVNVRKNSQDMVYNFDGKYSSPSQLYV